MKLQHKVILFLVVLLYMDTAVSYEPLTHRDLSQAAVNASVLRKEDAVLKNIGLEVLDKGQTFSIDGFTSRTIIEHIRRGSEIEDNGARSLNHFFDPLNDRGLFGLNPKSPDWALEDQKDISDQFSSFKDARDNFYSALTASAKDERERRFGLMFEKLGQVIHHLQDMAQPQHTRNDQHLDFPFIKLPGLENPSRYESYTRLVQSTPKFGELISPGSYPAVILSTARSFWHTETKNPKDGKGIAEFTNFNFVSAGTNFDTDRYEFPNLSEAVPHQENANALLQSVSMTPPEGCLPPNPPCVMTFYATEVKDKYRPAADAVNPRTSTESIFDQDLKARNLKPVFSLNRFNFDAAHQFLIPRAVAYSAGLIDYFFRGRLEAVDPAFTSQGITLRVKNAIDIKKYPQLKDELLKSGGKLVVAFEYKVTEDGQLRDKFDSSNEVNLQEDVPPGKTSAQFYEFTIPALPPNATQIKYRLVYRGGMGEEKDAVAAGTFKPGSGFVVQPSYTPQDGVTGKRNIYRTSGEWRLNSDNTVVAGNIDWKGWYVNGKPTKVLSWDGPQARYFLGGGFFSPNVYHNGEHFAVAPSLVLGAALYRDDVEEEWLVVIAASSPFDKIYRRPYKKDLSPALYDPVTAPDGWKEIPLVGPPSQGYTQRRKPWFFNGNGTEAQTMRHRKDAQSLNPILMRLKLNIEGDTAKLTEASSGSGFTTRTFRNPQKDEFKPGDTCTLGKLLDYTTGESHEYAAGTEWYGEYVVAVDYKDQLEVMAIASQTGAREQKGRIDDYVHVTAQCNSQYEGISNSIALLWLKEEGTYMTRVVTTMNFSRTLSIAGYQIPLGSEVGSHTTSVDHAGHFEKSGTSIIRDESEGVQSFNSTVSEEFDNIVYMDLRVDLVVIETERHTTTRNVIDKDGVDEPDTPNSETDSSYRIELLHPTESQQIYNRSENEMFITSMPAFCCFSIGGIIFAPHDQTFPPVYSDEFGVVGTIGSWAIDSEGNLAISQVSSFGHEPNSPPTYFHYLSRGKLNELLPGGPGEATYYPIGLVK